MSHIDVAPAGVGIDLLMDVQRRLRLLRHRQLDVIIHSLSLSLSLSLHLFSLCQFAFTGASLLYFPKARVPSWANLASIRIGSRSGLGPIYRCIDLA